MQPLHRPRPHGAPAPFRFAMADAQYAHVVSARRDADGLSRAATADDGQARKWSGILLPPSVPGALVNFAAMLRERSR